MKSNYARYFTRKLGKRIYDLKMYILGNQRSNAQEKESPLAGDRPWKRTHRALCLQESKTCSCVNY